MLHVLVPGYIFNPVLQNKYIYSCTKISFEDIFFKAVVFQFKVIEPSTLKLLHKKILMNPNMGAF